MSITTVKLSQLYKAFRFLSSEYYSENNRLEIIIKNISNTFETTAISVFRLTNEDINEIEELKSEKINSIIQLAKDEFLSSILSITQLEDRIKYFDHHRIVFYSICLGFKNVYYKEYVRSKINLIYNEDRYRNISSELIEDYMINLAYLAYKWAYNFREIEYSFIQKNNLKNIEIPFYGFHFKESHIFDMLFMNESESIYIYQEMLKQFSDYIECDTIDFKSFMLGQKSNTKIIWKHEGERKNKKKEPNIILLTKFVIIAKNLDFKTPIFQEYKEIIEEYFRLPNTESIIISNNKQSSFCKKNTDGDYSSLKKDKHVSLFIKIFQENKENIERKYGD